jgi:DNA repair exonuclease SbcCD nuclease subunit
MHLRKYLIFFLIALLMTQVLSANKNSSTTNTFNISVISDLHYFNPILGNSGECFNEYLKGDRKMLAESDAILNAAFESLKKENSEIILIPGDLTKDGELLSHRIVAEKLSELEKAGKKCYVIPGNHDINNPEAMMYSGDTCFRTESISPKDFTEIYNEHGYNEAITKDVSSLSYIAQPIENLWILAIDDNIYDKNYELGKEVVGGRIKESTMLWIEEHLSKAKELGVTVIAMMHHGLLEHFEGQKEIFNDYVIEDWHSRANRLADAGLKIVFTGHFHAQDISSMHFENGSFIYDIQTGSLLTYPCPYRNLSIINNEVATVETVRIQNIDYDLNDIDFQDHAREFLRIGIETITGGMLDKFGMSQDDKNKVLPLITNGLMSHYEGDEYPDEEVLSKIEELKSDESPMKQLIGKLLSSIWQDLKPADNDLEIDLKNGNSVQLTQKMKNDIKN